MTIKAGTAQGITPGTIVAVYAPDAVRLSGNDKKLATGTVSTVAAFTSKVKLNAVSGAQSKNTAETKAELSAEQRQAQMLESQVEQLQTSSVDQIRDTIFNVVLSIDYLVGVTRGGEKKVKTLDVPANARLVRVTLEVVTASFELFNILLRHGDESIVWRRSGLKAKQVGDRRKLNLAVPAQTLTPGNYDLLVAGAAPEGDAELIGRYFLNVERKRATR